MRKEILREKRRRTGRKVFEIGQVIIPLVFMVYNNFKKSKLFKSFI